MRRTRRWLIAFACLVTVVGGAVAFYYKFVDTAYFETEFYRDSTIVPVQNTDGIREVYYEERPGRVVLSMIRGEPHGIVTTEHDWWEGLAIEIPAPSPGQRVDLAEPDLRALFWSYDGRQFPTIGEGGIRGYLQFESVGSRRIVATYEIAIDGVYPRRGNAHRDVVFSGRSTFHLAPRPGGAHGGHVWPPVTKQ
jgi:hypothetical protein